MRNQNKNSLVANIGLNRKQISFIDKIAREIRFSGGRKPSRSSIVRTFTKIAMLLRPDVSGIRSEKESEKRFFQAFKIGSNKSGKNDRNSISKSLQDNRQTCRKRMGRV